MDNMVTTRSLRTTSRSLSLRGHYVVTTWPQRSFLFKDSMLYGSKRTSKSIKKSSLRTGNPTLQDRMNSDLLPRKADENRFPKFSHRVTRFSEFLHATSSPFRRDLLCVTPGCKQKLLTENMAETRTNIIKQVYKIREPLRQSN